MGSGRERTAYEKELLNCGKGHIVKSLCCIPESYTVFYVNYISIKLGGKRSYCTEFNRLYETK